MGRAQKQKRRGSLAASAQVQPSALGDGKGAGVTKRTGTERPDPATGNPRDLADPTARVIKTDD